jgi:hypothetical protein
MRLLLLLLRPQTTLRWTYAHKCLTTATTAISLLQLQQDDVSVLMTSALPGNQSDEPAAELRVVMPRVALHDHPLFCKEDRCASLVQLAEVLLMLITLCTKLYSSGDCDSACDSAREQLCIASNATMLQS